MKVIIEYDKEKLEQLVNNDNNVKKFYDKYMIGKDTKVFEIDENDEFIAAFINEYC